VVESVKAVSDLVSPVGGEVVEANTPVADDPSIINNSPYGDGWLIKVHVTARSEELISADEYVRYRAS
jgi:glycine cleavage system H protein